MISTGPVEDRLAIRELVESYNDAVMRFDGDAWASNWTDDATWSLPGMGDVTGKANFFPMWQRAMSAYTFVGFFASAGPITVTGSTATGRWYQQEFLHRADGVRDEVTGRYDDEYVKRDGRWYFQRRTYSILQRSSNTARLEDREAIKDQMWRYARATDWLETENHRKVFVEDCVFASPHSGDVHGVDGVVAWMNRALAPFDATQHLISDVWITFTGADTADAVSYVRAWHRYTDRTKPDLVLWGEYHDHWVRVEGTWRIKERRVLEAGIEPERAGGVPNPRRAAK